VVAVDVAVAVVVVPVGVGVEVLVGADVLVGVGVGVGVSVGVGVEVGVAVLVGVGGTFMCSTTAPSGWAAPMNAVPSQLVGISSFSSIFRCKASPGANASKYSVSVR